MTLSVHDLSGNRIAEHADTGAVIREYIWLDGRPLAVVEGGQVFWLHWDHILRPVLATDATGAVVWAARYLPFGGIDQAAQTPRYGNRAFAFSPWQSIAIAVLGFRSTTRIKLAIGASFS